MPQVVPSPHKVLLTLSASQHYNLTVTASNFLAPNQLISTVLVLVQILEVNEFAPAFPRVLYQVSVLENLPAGQLLLPLVATDLDAGLGWTAHLPHHIRQQQVVL